MHQLLHIMVVAICAVICGADTWVEVELFGRSKLVWLKGFLELPNGIPSHDTFGRVFGLLDPDEFQTGFLRWVQAISHVTRGQVIGVDGKQLRGSRGKRLAKAAIYLVSAWAREAQGWQPGEAAAGLFSHSYRNTVFDRAITFTNWLCEQHPTISLFREEYHDTTAHHRNA